MHARMHTHTRTHAHALTHARARTRHENVQPSVHTSLTTFANARHASAGCTFVMIGNTPRGWAQSALVKQWDGGVVRPLEDHYVRIFVYGFGQLMNSGIGPSV